MELTSIEYITRKRLPWAETVLIPLGDIQHQTNRDAVDWRRLERVVAWGVEHNALWLGMGDFVDNESPSNRQALKTAGIYDSVVDALDYRSEELEDDIKKLLAPTVGRWVGTLGGHHYHVYQDGTTTDTRMAQYLKCPYLGDSAYVNLAFDMPKNQKQAPITFNILARHGSGSGRTAGAPVNNIERQITGFDADLYVQGHTHQAGAVPRDRIYPYFGPKIGSLVHKTMYLVSTGSFLKSYIDGHKRDGRAQGMYPEKAGMNPAHLGVAKIWFRPRYETIMGRGEATIDLSVEV